MEYTLYDLVVRMGLETPPCRDELVRWSFGDGVANSDGGFAEVYLSEDGRILTVDVQNYNLASADYPEEGIGQLYMQAEKLSGHAGFAITKLQIDGYKDFDLTDGITTDLGLSIIFGSINEVKMNAEHESFSYLSYELVEDERRKERLQKAQQNSDTCKIIDFQEAFARRHDRKYRYGA